MLAFFEKKMTLYGSENRASSRYKMRNGVDDFVLFLPNWQILHYIHINNVGFFWKKITLYGSETELLCKTKWKMVLENFV